MVDAAFPPKKGDYHEEDQDGLDRDPQERRKPLLVSCE
jgi:hypothetical protein